MQRFKIYQVPHKGFRSAIAQLVIQAGSADYNDDADLAAVRIARENKARHAAGLPTCSTSDETARSST